MLRYLIMIKQKSIMDFIREDPGLSEKITYEEYMKRLNRPSGFDDSGIEEAYETYKKVIQEIGEDV